MTFAPNDLKILQEYLHTRTGLAWDALGIIHSSPQGGGYHEGFDLLAAANRAPGVQYAYSDYSYAESPDRDRPYVTDAASALDVGDFRTIYNGRTVTHRTIIDLVLAEINKPGRGRCHDLREMIYESPEGSGIVRRWDALGVRNTGDSTHTTHTHLSFFRDSEGRRANTGNFIDLIKEAFEGTPSSPPPSGNQEDEDMGFTRDIPLTSFDSVCVNPVLDGIDPRPAYFNVQNDTNGGTYRLRIWVCNTSGQWFPLGDEVVGGNGGYVTLGNGQRKSLSVGKGTSCFHVSRVAGPDGTTYTGPLTWALERGARV
jgi:hypothetical protein